MELFTNKNIKDAKMRELWQQVLAEQEFKVWQCYLAAGSESTADMRAEAAKLYEQEKRRLTRQEALRDLWDKTHPITDDERQEELTLGLRPTDLE